MLERRAVVVALAAVAAAGGVAGPGCRGSVTTPLTYAPALRGRAVEPEPGPPIVVAPVEDERPPFGDMVGFERYGASRIEVLSDVEPAEWVRRAVNIALHESGATLLPATGAGDVPDAAVARVYLLEAWAERRSASEVAGARVRLALQLERGGHVLVNEEVSGVAMCGGTTPAAHRCALEGALSLALRDLVARVSTALEAAPGTGPALAGDAAGPSGLASGGLRDPFAPGAARAGTGPGVEDAAAGALEGPGAPGVARRDGARPEPDGSATPTLGGAPASDPAPAPATGAGPDAAPPPGPPVDPFGRGDTGRGLWESGPLRLVDPPGALDVDAGVARRVFGLGFGGAALVSATTGVPALALMIQASVPLVTMLRADATFWAVYDLETDATSRYDVDVSIAALVPAHGVIHASGSLGLGGAVVRGAHDWPALRVPARLGVTLDSSTGRFTFRAELAGALLLDNGLTTVEIGAVGTFLWYLTRG
ncbi:MAG TPA: hypothetical protein VG389_06090 [Myxococcota bacterium]|jgi:hypothetical protein|nr:hypothetical protein [Myxococcota bacterium]